MKKEGERLVGFILGVLSSIDRPTMVEWIKTDFMPPVFEFELPPYLIGVKSLMADYKDQILEGLTVANTVKYCNEYRPGHSARTTVIAGSVGALAGHHRH